MTKQIPMVTGALRMGSWRRDRASQAVGDGLVHYNDAGSQYTLTRFAETLQLKGIAASVARDHRAPSRTRGPGNGRWQCLRRGGQDFSERVTPAATATRGKPVALLHVVGGALETRSSPTLTWDGFHLTPWDRATRLTTTQAVRGMIRRSLRPFLNIVAAVAVLSAGRWLVFQLAVYTHTPDRARVRCVRRVHRTCDRRRPTAGGGSRVLDNGRLAGLAAARDPLSTGQEFDLKHSRSL
jgi:hypothetical protein